jgi:hypothetical protein
VSAPYPAAQTAQLTAQGEATSTLVVHELGPDGDLLCGIRPRMWKGRQMVITPQGRGTVTCALCARSARRGAA